MVNFISKSGVFFGGVQLNDFLNSYNSCGMAPPHIIGASDFVKCSIPFSEPIQGSVRGSLVLFIPPQNVVLGGYTVFSIAVIPLFRQHLRCLLYNFVSFV